MPVSAIDCAKEESPNLFRDRDAHLVVARLNDDVAHGYVGVARAIVLAGFGDERSALVIQHGPGSTQRSSINGCLVLTSFTQQKSDINRKRDNTHQGEQTHRKEDHDLTME